MNIRRHSRVLRNDLWILANAFRILNRYTGADEIKAQELSEKLFDEIREMRQQINGQESFELLFPSGLTKNHAVYLSLLCTPSEIHFIVFNAGDKSRRHNTEKMPIKASDKPTSETTYVFPKRVGSLLLSDNKNEFIQYLKNIHIGSQGESKDLNNIVQSLYDSPLLNKPDLAGIKTSHITSFQRQRDESTCVVYSLLAWLHCRTSAISSLNNNVVRHWQESIYYYMLRKTEKAAVSNTTREDSRPSDPYDSHLQMCYLGGLYEKENKNNLVTLVSNHYAEQIRENEEEPAVKLLDWLKKRL